MSIEQKWKLISYVTLHSRFSLQIFFTIYFIQSRVYYLQLTLLQLIQPGLGSRFIVRYQLGPIIQAGSSPSAGLQVVTQSTHLSKAYYPQLILNPHRITPPWVSLMFLSTKSRKALRFKIFISLIIEEINIFEMRRLTKFGNIRMILMILLASACNFTKSITLPRVFFTLFELYKWHQIAQSVSF